ncbi:MAG: hypothetical protein J6T67_11550 [Paludibacteraceae bacterium]|nr:hypothetical protein [Paludibacteraceae bacterium]
MVKKLFILNILVMSLGILHAQTITGRYCGCQYKATKNAYFINKEMLFVTDHEDSVYINIKFPRDTSNSMIVDYGIYHNCTLKKDSTYTISLTKISRIDLNVIYKDHYSGNIISEYYRNNITCLSDDGKFEEIERNTPYSKIITSNVYVDIDNFIYKISDLSPKTDCFFPH